MRQQNRLRQQNCNQARQTLGAIKEKRRHGYELADANGLNQQEITFRKIVKTDC